jgi:hypothetical protein
MGIVRDGMLVESQVPHLEEQFDHALSPPHILLAAART